MTLSSCTQLVVLLLSSQLFASTAFLSPGGIISSGISSHQNILAPKSRFARNRHVTFRHKRNKKGDEDEAEDFYSVDDQDWRAFRAKLVHDEPAQQQSHDSFTNTQHTNHYQADADCLPASGECDLDEIGQLYQPLDTKENVQHHHQQQHHQHQPYNARQSPFFQQINQHQQQEQHTSSSMDPSSQHWAYEAGPHIEQGAVLLGGVEKDFIGYGLRQQYFHKAAILVLDHDEVSFTKGIILNRPTDLELMDDMNPGARWKVWYGGDVQGLNSDRPDFVCLHSLQYRQAKQASIPVMKDIQWTSFENAKKLVHSGGARPEDFQVFCGYAGWGPGQLLSELDDHSWYMVAADSQTILKEMTMAAHSDPRDAGLETWTMLMRMIGRGKMADEVNGIFDDLMLKEWSRHHLLSQEHGGGAGPQTRFLQKVADVVIDVAGVFRKDPVNEMMDRASSAAQGQDMLVGDLVRAAPVEPPPFLLSDQELHKSVILILSDDEKYTVGAILNRPVARGMDLHTSRNAHTVNVPLRFGGQYSIQDSEPLLWIHRSESLRARGVGHPVGPAETNIWKCSGEDVTMAISQGYANPEDFFVITGVSVWTKDNPSNVRGMQGEIERGQFEIIPPYKADAVWEALSRQKPLTPENLENNVDNGDAAWTHGCKDRSDILPSINQRSGNLDQADTYVFKSHVSVSKLADVALRNWVATFLLGVRIPAVDS